MLTSFIFITLLCLVLQAEAGYRIGLGRADCTGPITDVNFMGYANLAQKGRGLHTRQFARTFIVEDEKGNAVVFVSIDSAMTNNFLRNKVISRLQETYGKKYGHQNVIFSATHSHSTPGGYMVHILLDLSIFGFVPQTYQSYIDGIFLSIKRAIDSLQKGRVFYSETTVLNVNINRSPQAYANNPAMERHQYEHNVDKTLTQLKFYDALDNLIGVFNWFAVHPVSMNNTNHLVSSDNVGYASMLLEEDYNKNNLPGKGFFVGSFSSTNLGDVSPNIKGPVCEISKRPCDILSSRCPKGEGECFASGPGKNMFESTRIIAERIYEKSKELIKSSNRGVELVGEVSSIYRYVDMSTYRGVVYNKYSRKVEKLRGCYPAMGYSFAAGTIDGQGIDIFKQGETSGNPLFDELRDFLAPPTEEDIRCHYPKPILIATGRAEFPFEWQPNIVSTQLLQIGQLFIAALPGEPTTMAGRRIKNHISSTASSMNKPNTKVILAGLSNYYTNYITTQEEYMIQRYEGASTIYGPDSLNIYMEELRKLAEAIIQGIKLDEGPTPPEIPATLPTIVHNSTFDGHPIKKNFGYVKEDVDKIYRANKTVRCTFVAGNPRNDLKHEGTFLTVEKLVNGKWEVIANDASWDTKFYWKRSSTLMSFSDSTVEWYINYKTQPGQYRIRHFGNYLDVMGGVFPYEGVSSNFTIIG